MLDWLDHIVPAGELIISVELMSKVAYSFTILVGLRLLYRTFKGRKINKFIRTLFIVYLLLVPLYCAFAILYVFDIYYQHWVGFFGWATINTLFLITDNMLVEHIIRQSTMDKNHETV